MNETRFRALLTEYLDASKFGASVPHKPKQLTIEGEPDQHLCEQVTLNTSTTKAEVPPHYRTFMVEVIDLPDDSSADDASIPEPTPPAVIDLTITDPSPIQAPSLSIPTTPIPYPGQVPAGVWIPYQHKETPEIWTIHELVQWAHHQQITVTGWESKGLSPETIDRMFEPENGYTEVSPTPFDYNPMEPRTQPKRKGKQPIQPPVRWDDYERIWRDRHPGLNYYGRPHPPDSNLVESAISATRHRSSTMDRGMQTDGWTGGYRWPRPSPHRSGLTFEESHHKHRSL